MVPKKSIGTFLDSGQLNNHGCIEETEWKLEKRSIKAVAIYFCGDLV